MNENDDDDYTSDLPPDKIHVGVSNSVTNANWSSAKQRHDCLHVRIRLSHTSKIQQHERTCSK